MPWNYTETEYIKIYRKLIDWEWYTDISVKTTFLHCLLRANWKDSQWHGISIKRGQFITSYKSFADECGLSYDQVRRAFLKLKRTGSLTWSSQGKSLLVSVVEWDEHQNQATIEPRLRTTKSQPKAKQKPTDIRTYKNNKEDKNNKAPSADPDEERFAGMTDEEITKILNSEGWVEDEYD